MKRTFSAVVSLLFVVGVLCMLSGCVQQPSKAEKMKAEKVAGQPCAVSAGADAVLLRFATAGAGAGIGCIAAAV